MRKALILTTALVMLLQPVMAGNAKAESLRDMHIQSAFLFAKRQNWHEAVAHARMAHDEILEKYFIWEYLRDPQSDATFEQINRFLDENPSWPDRTLLEKHAEVALMAANPTDDMLDEWFSKHPSQTNLVKLKRAKNAEALKAMIRSAWVSDNYDKATEKRILEKYHSILRSSDHVRRIDRLLWEGNESDAKRLLKYVPRSYQRLFQARIALTNNEDSGPAALKKVPRELMGDAGLIYARIWWRMRENDRDGVRELLLSAPAQVPYPEKWWRLRDRQVREALAEGNVHMAERLLQRTGQKPDTVEYKEAEWLRGWITLEYRHSPDKAYEMFTKLHEQMETPFGKARAAYWAGRSAQHIVKSDPARWFGEASRYPTTFYGQLADWELQKHDENRHGHYIESSVQPTQEERERFKRRELVRLVYTLSAAQQTDLAGRFIFYIAQNAKSDSEAILATELGRDIKRIDFAVRASKKILLRDIVALENGWPVIHTPQAAIEKALILGLTRQESEFYPYAISPSGAVGLMQLLPGTAKETAKKAGLSYSGDQLFQPEYNMTVGSAYMARMVNRFNGSYVLAIASYNAGPGRVTQWLGEFGAPAANVHSMVDWIERIPTSETRNYVEHVMENIEVYRFLLGGKTDAKTLIADDLLR
ncbi:MAG TPA: lytic transglycosylase domain-containing protein [Rickettsiales bacterium]|nr:lytic transglycosylase domain-containing protein [Rickettsiales bacterium]